MKQSFLGIFIVLGLFVCFTSATAFAAEDTVCIQCHGGLEGRLAEPVELWRSSVHAANGISCNDCHGGDPTDFAMAMSPERGFIGAPSYTEVPDFCGRCHVGVKEDYLASAHGKALDAGGAQCVICHGNHAVKAASIDLINKESCSRCHDYERAARVKEEISSTETTLAKLEQAVSSLHRLGIDTKRLEESLFASRNSFRRIFHTVNLDKIKAQKAEVTDKLKGTRAAIADYESILGKRKLAGGVVVLLLLLGGAIALLIRRSYHEEE